MLKLFDINKTYHTGEEDVEALKGINVQFRKAEFVSVLGPSGCGKTTLLNVIGGLDRYTSGDLVIDGRSTKEYGDKDWDAYRNYRVGFVFQSYNLISHQTVLSNVELALTLSGISKKERRERAEAALEKVGLSDQINKKPSQLSGGQMQRVAIARAIVNDPEIILADEPTGALDSKTSEQIMEILYELAAERLVIVVTHNQDLALKYSSRIISLLDGEMIDDTNPYEEEEIATMPAEKRKTRMGFGTALRLSTNNLLTKKGRTLLTAFAGSIGIIGIALIVSLSSGMQDYITELQEDTMASYPVTISQGSSELTDILNGDFTSGGGGGGASTGGSTGGLSSILSGITGGSGGSGDSGGADVDSAGSSSDSSSDHGSSAVYSDTSSIERASRMNATPDEDEEEEEEEEDTSTTNNLTAFKEYLEDDTSEIQQYIGTAGVVYSYDISYNVFAYDTDGTLVNTDGSTFETDDDDDDDDSGSASSADDAGGGASFGSIGSGGGAGGVMDIDLSSIASSFSSGSSLFSEVLSDIDGNVSSAVTDTYTVVSGLWPSAYNEVIIVMDENNEISATTLYKLGLLPASDYTEILEQIDDGEELELDAEEISYDDIVGSTFYLIPACDYYQYDEDTGLYEYIGDDDDAVEDLVENAIELTIVGIVQENEDSESSLITTTIGYTTALTNYLIDYTNASEVVTAQLADTEVSVLTGLMFSPSTDSEKATDAKVYIDSLSTSEKAQLALATLDSDTVNSVTMSQTEIAEVFDDYIENTADTDFLVDIYDSYITVDDYADTLSTLGQVDADSPTSISIYVDSFDDKESIITCLDNYNDSASDENQITYTDSVSVITDSFSDIINTITYILIGFVSISLVVSSIMIAIITYISVLERTKEIGILRALGASKNGVSKIFNAETIIEGLISGVMGILLTLVLIIPMNAIIENLTSVSNMASLDWKYAALFILISVALTLIAGFIPSRSASKKDPAVVLRSD